MFRIRERLCFFAHIPKCGGGSVIRYLSQRFGHLGFINPRYGTIPQHQRWTNTSAQHVPYDAFRRLVPEDWIDASFAVVRDPLSRLESGFRMRQRLQPNRYNMPLAEFLKQWIDVADQHPFRYDNHFMPQTHFISPKTRIFKIEDGMDNIVRYLDEISGDKNGPREIGHDTRGSEANRDEPLAITSEVITLVRDYYKKDYEVLGYNLPEITSRNQII